MIGCIRSVLGWMVLAVLVAAYCAWITYLVSQ